MNPWKFTFPSIRQSTSTDPIVEGADFTVTYKLYNTGEATATNIEVIDKYDTIRYISHFHNIFASMTLTLSNLRYSFEGVNNVDEEGSVHFEFDAIAPGNFL